MIMMTMMPMTTFKFRVLFVALAMLAARASAAEAQLGTVTLEIPAPAGHVQVVPRMTAAWRLVEAAQGDNRILAFFIAEQEQARALEGKMPNLERNINVQTRRKFESAIVSPAMFQMVKAQVLALVASRQIDALQAREFERINGNIERFSQFNPQIKQTGNITLPPHVDAPDEFAFSEVSEGQVTMPDGTVERGRMAATAAALLIKGKVLYCYATGGPADLAWTRAVAKEWVAAIRAANAR